MRSFVRLVVSVRRSKWMPLVAKIVASFGVIAALGFVGTGAADGWIRTRRAAAAGALPSAPTATPALNSAAARASADPPPAASSVVPSVSASASSSAGAAPCAADGKIVLNTATAADLDKLPGVGPSKAIRIIELREKLGRFTRLEELFRIKGIKRRLLEKIRPLVVLDPPPGCSG